MLVSMALASSEWPPVGTNSRYFLKGFSRTRGGDHLIALKSGLAQQVYSLLVIRFSFGGIGRDTFVESHNGLIGFPGIGEHRTHIEVILSGRAGVGLGGLFVGLYRVVNLAGFAVGLGEIVVIGGESLGGVGVFLICSGLLELQSLLIGRRRRNRDVFAFPRNRFAWSPICGRHRPA